MFLPRIISIIATYQCTASCPNCCFKCTPKRKEALSLEKLESIIEQATAIPTVKLITFTGGECFLLGEDLFAAIAKCKNAGFKSRCVTNAYWAKNRDTTKLIVSRLTEVGLTELNISTGDEHGKFVKLENVINASICAAKSGITVVVNIEDHSNAKIKHTDLMESEEVTKFVLSGKIRLINGTWIPIGDNADPIAHDSSRSRFSDANMRPCTNIGNALSIRPNEDVVACCGLTIEQIPDLTIGSIKNMGLKEIIESSPHDLLKMAIMLYGPEKLLSMVKEEFDDIALPGNVFHPCQTCRYIYNTPSLRLPITETLKKNEVDLVSNLQFYLTKFLLNENVEHELSKVSWI